MDKIKSNNWNRILSILLSQWKCLKYRWSTFFIHASGYTVNNQIYVSQSLMPKNSYWVTWKIFMTCMMSDGKMENYQFFWLRNLSTLNYLFNVMLEGYCMVLSHGRLYKINKTNFALVEIDLIQVSRLQDSKKFKMIRNVKDWDVFLST